MLNKLMKYELKATSRLLVPLYLILLVMSIVNRFVFKLDEFGGTAGVIGQFLVVIYITTIFAVLIVTVIYMIVRFYKNLLTDEGYLMFTLPVKTHQHITSKLLITLFWTIVSIAAVLISLFVAFASPETLPYVSNGIKEVIAELNKAFNGSAALLFIEFIVMMLLSLVVNILLIYVSIAVGQLFTKHKIIGSFAAYMIIYTILQFLLIIIMIPFGIFVSKQQPEISSLPHVVLPIAMVVVAAGGACFYFLTNYIFTKKLNLD